MPNADFKFIIKSKDYSKKTIKGVDSLGMFRNQMSPMINYGIHRTNPI